MKERRYDIDWLRVVAMLAVFFFHCARFFVPIDWHLQNAEQSIPGLIFSSTRTFLCSHHGTVRTVGKTY